jgi:ATP-dependent protease ClpP protease subunit
MKSSFKFNKKRCILLKSSFTENIANELVEKLFQLDKSEGEIILHINSTGGDVYAFKILYDNILLCQNKVIGIVAGSCFSAATLALQACQKRYATPFSVLGIHYINYPISFTVRSNKDIGHYIKFLENEFDFMHNNNKKIINHLKLRMTLSESQIHKLLLEEKELNVYQAKNYGLIDEIINL